MRIRYKISILVTLLTVVIIALITFSYFRVVIWAADKFAKEYLQRQVHNILVDLPPGDEIDWDNLQAYIDHAVQESDDLLYIAIYDNATDEIKLESPERLIKGLRSGDMDIENAREIELFIQSSPGSTSLRVVIGYIFPISDRALRSIITWSAMILILVFTAIAIVMSFLLAGGITKPISKLASAMQDVSEGNLDTAVRVPGRDEVGQLAKVFNKMMYQLKEKTTELEELNRTLEERVRRGVAELARRDEAEKQRLLGEIQRAREVQMGLFPQSPPRISGLDIWGVCYPASEVGGDFFDYLRLGTNRLCIALGDVSGKGMRGAMNAVMAHGMLHAQARVYSSAATIISELNSVLSTRLGEATFTALSLGIIDTASKEIQLCNAGNPYPVFLREGKASLLELGGMPLGIISEIEHDEAKLSLMPGDVFIFYSDGISEAMTSDDRIYGVDALRELIETFTANLSAQSMVERILQDVRRFAGDFPQSDDMTIVVVRIREIG